MKLQLRMRVASAALGVVLASVSWAGTADDVKKLQDDIARAKGNAADTRKEWSSAQSEYTATRKRLLEASQSSPEYIEAKRAVDDTQRAYVEASTAVLTKLGTDPGHQKAVADKLAAEERLSRLRSAGDDGPDVAAAAAAYAAASRAVSSMESKALDADPATVQAAKARAEANAVFSRLVAKAEAALSQSTDLAAITARMTAASQRAAGYDREASALRRDLAVKSQQLKEEQYKEWLKAQEQAAKNNNSGNNNNNNNNKTTPPKHTSSGGRKTN